MTTYHRGSRFSSYLFCSTLTVSTVVGLIVVLIRVPHLTRDPLGKRKRLEFKDAIDGASDGDLSRSAMLLGGVGAGVSNASQPVFSRAHPAP